MRKSCLSFAILFLLVGLPWNATAETVKMKHLASAYADSVGMKLKNPEGVACQDTSFLVADTGNSRIVRYSFQNTSLAVETEFPLDNGYPIVVQASSTGDIYYLDGRERRIGILSVAGEPKGFMQFQGLPSDDAIIPRSFKIDSDDNLNILDIFSATITVVSRDGKYIKSIPLPEEYGFISDLTIDSRGKIFVLDSVNAQIFGQTGPDENFLPLTGNMKEYMNFPTGIAIDQGGQIFLTDQFGSGLVLIGRDGSFKGRKISMGWIDGLLFYPSQLCINSRDELYIADRSNSRVQVFGLVAK